MRKRSLTLVMSYLLVAAFIGSAEAKKIDTAYNTGAGIIQFATDPNSGIASDITAGGLNDGIEWLLAFYYGIEEENPNIKLENKSNDSSDSLPAGDEHEEDFSLGGMWSGRTIAGLSPTSGTSSSTNPEASAASAPSAAGKVPASEKNRTKLPPSNYFADQQVTININTGATPKTKKDPHVGNSQPPLANSPDKPKKKDKKDPVININPDENQKTEKNPHTTPPEVVAVKKPKVKDDKKPKVAKKSDGFVPPVAIIDTITIPPIVNQQSGYVGSIVQAPPDSSPAPVPEPATTLLLLAGLAGLAIGGVKGNKNAGTEIRG